MYGSNGAGVGNQLSHRQRGPPSTARIIRPGTLSGWQLSRDGELGPQMRNPSLFCLKEPRLPQRVSARSALWTQAPKFRLVDQRNTLAFEKTENVERLRDFTFSLGLGRNPSALTVLQKGFFKLHFFFKTMGIEVVFTRSFLFPAFLERSLGIFLLSFPPVRRERWDTEAQEYFRDLIRRLADCRRYP